MRILMALILIAVTASPAIAALKGPSASSSPVSTATLAQEADEGATCVLEGSIIEHLAKDRYTFKDKSGSIVVNIPPHVFGTLEVTPQNTVKLTGEIRGKKDRNRQDAHLGVRYIEIVK